MGLMNASILIVPTASKKLFTTAPGRPDASDVRIEDRPLTLTPVYPATELEPCDWYISDEPVVPTLIPAVLDVGAWYEVVGTGPEKPRNESGGGIRGPVLLRFRLCALGAKPLSE